MKSEFLGFLDANPPALAGSREPVASPYFPHLLKAPAFALIALMVLSGSAYAAEESLPTDLLYPIKTSVIEPIFIEGLAFSKLEKARAGNSLVTRRLEEAAKLIDDNEFDAEVASIIAASIDEHTGSVHAYVSEAAISGDLAEALDVGTDLENAFEAHGDVLASLVDDKPSTLEVYDFIDDVNDRALLIEDKGDEIEDQTSESSSDEIDEYIEAAVEGARESIEEARAGIESAELAEELVSEAAALLDASEDSFSEGTRLLEEGNVREAFPIIRDALQSAEQAVILLDSEEELEQ